MADSRSHNLFDTRRQYDERMAQLHLHEIALPLLRPFVTANGTIGERRTVLVGITRDGLTGWGEAAPYPGVTDETLDATWDGLKGEVAAILERRPAELSPSAAAAVDEAEHDVEARLQGRPLWAMLGGSQEPVPAGLAIGIADDPDEMLGEVEAAVSTGIASFKLKIRPGYDDGPCRRLRRHFPEVSIAADANGSYEMEDPFFDLIDELGLVYVEQPMAATRLHEHAVLRQRIETPICLDESAAPAPMAIRAVEMGAADVLCLKPSRLGHRAAGEIAKLARQAGMSLKASGMVESTIGKAHTLALATGPDFEHADLVPAATVFGGDVCPDGLRIENGQIDPSDRPGIGFEPDPRALARFGVRSLSLSR